MKGVNISQYLILAIPLPLLTFISFSRSFHYQPEKPEKFIFDSCLDKCAGVDVPALQNKLTSVVEWVCRNDLVMDHPVGFNAIIGFRGIILM
jgi:hypothetical protein